MQTHAITEHCIRACSKVEKHEIDSGLSDLEKVIEIDKGVC
jgi:hypothetical protein